MIVVVADESELDGAEQIVGEAVRDHAFQAGGVVIFRCHVPESRGGSVEVDALVCTPQSVTIVEVKGFTARQEGTLATPPNGPWTIDGEPAALYHAARVPNPFVQVRRQVFAAKSLLQQTGIFGWVNAVIALVPQPGAEITIEETRIADGYRAVLVDRDDASALHGYFDAESGRTVRLSVEDVTRVFAALNLGHQLPTPNDLMAQGFPAALDPAATNRPAGPTAIDPSPPASGTTDSGEQSNSVAASSGSSQVRPPAAPAFLAAIDRLAHRPPATVTTSSIESEGPRDSPTPSAESTSDHPADSERIPTSAAGPDTGPAAAPVIMETTATEDDSLISPTPAGADEPAADDAPPQHEESGFADTVDEVRSVANDAQAEGITRTRPEGPPTGASVTQPGESGPPAVPVGEVLASAGVVASGLQAPDDGIADEQSSPADDGADRPPTTGVVVEPTSPVEELDLQRAGEPERTVSLSKSADGPRSAAIDDPRTDDELAPSAERHNESAPAQIAEHTRGAGTAVGAGAAAGAVAAARSVSGSESSDTASRPRSTPAPHRFSEQQAPQLNSEHWTDWVEHDRTGRPTLLHRWLANGTALRERWHNRPVRERRAPKRGLRVGPGIGLLLFIGLFGAGFFAITAVKASQFAMSDYDRMCSEDKKPFSNSAPYERDGARPIYLSGNLTSMVSPGDPTAWNPRDPSTVQLIACMKQLELRDLVQTCQYGPGPGAPIGRTVNLFRATYEVSVYELHTGREVAKATMLGERYSADPSNTDPDRCRAAADAPDYLGRRLGLPSNAQLTGFLAPLVHADRTTP